MSDHIALTGEENMREDVARLLLEAARVIKDLVDELKAKGK